MISAFKSIEQAALSVVGYDTHKSHISFFINLHFEESPIFPSLLIRDISFARSFQPFTTTGKYTLNESIKFCAAEKKLLLNFIS